MAGVYDDHRIRFQYPEDWEIEVTDDGPRTTVSLQAPGGLAFAMVTVDDSCPAPADMADEALEAMREEYPGLDVTPAVETIDGHKASGHDLEFFSLDMVTSCAIRSYRTPQHTVLVFGQWSELAEDNPEEVIRQIRSSLEETDNP